MTDKVFRTLVAAINGAGYKARSYSGRFMYGKECLGVTLSRGQSETDFVLDIAEFDPTVAQLLRHPTSDAMGLGIIIYWPSIEWRA
mgnify:CR=1 FL=1